MSSMSETSPSLLKPVPNQSPHRCRCVWTLITSLISHPPSVSRFTPSPFRGPIPSPPPNPNSIMEHNSTPFKFPIQVSHDFLSTLRLPTTQNVPTHLSPAISRCPNIESYASLIFINPQVHVTLFLTYSCMSLHQTY